MIKGILNGYYRSGSTMLFEIMEKSNPTNIVLYEPLNPEIFFSFLRFGKDYEEGLHKYKIYHSYSRFSKKNFLETREKHSKIKYNYFDFNKAIGDYLNCLHRTNKEIILQTNRAHFILKEIKKKYGCPIIHLIRNPINEWGSFNNPTFIGDPNKEKKGKNVKSILNILSKIKNFNDLFFVIKEIFHKILYNTGPFSLHIEYKKMTDKLNKKYQVRDDYDKFICLWTILNNKAIESLSKENILWYEDLILDKKKILSLKNLLKLNINTKLIKINKKKITFKQNELKEFWIRARRLGLEKKVNLILSTNEKIKNMFSL